MIGKSTLRRARRSAMAVATILAAGAVVAPAAGAAIVHSTPVPTYQTNGRVNAIVIQNGVIYIAGRFTAVRPAGSTSGSVTRNHAAALSQATGQVLSWNPDANGTVQSLAAGNGTDLPRRLVLERRRHGAHAPGRSRRDDRRRRVRLQSPRPAGS